MSLKQVSSFQTSDGVLHQNKLKALVHERKLEVRGIVQSGPGKIPLKNGHVTTEECIQIISENIDTLTKIFSTYKRAINKEQTKLNSQNS